MKETSAAQAANDNPLSDEYVNAIIQRHGYDSPETVIARLAQWIGLHGGENGVTLLMYEAHKTLSELRAPVDERAPEQAAPGLQYHILKTDPEVFQAVLSGAKTFEIRLNDRGYAVGDVLGLCETKHTGAEMRAGAPLVYTGRECQRFVSHVLTGYGLADGWCCLSFRLPHAGGASAPVAGEAQPANIKSRRPTGVLSMHGASIHMKPDGSGEIIVAEEDFTLEDDRDEGPDGPQGSVHWVARLPASEIAALRNFLTGHARPSDDALWDQTLAERDEYHDVADKLANAIADHLLIEIGEHSSSNCPWMRALEAIENAAPQASAEAVRNAALEEAAKEMDRLHAENRRWHNEFREAAAVVRALKQPQADKDGAEQALKDLVTHGISVQRIAPADFLADRQQRAGDVDLLHFAWKAIRAELDPQWECNSYHPILYAAEERLRAALSAAQAEQGERDE